MVQSLVFEETNLIEEGSMINLLFLFPHQLLLLLLPRPPFIRPPLSSSPPQEGLSQEGSESRKRTKKSQKKKKNRGKGRKIKEKVHPPPSIVVYI
jgi:hypothetical protein